MAKSAGGASSFWSLVGVVSGPNKLTVGLLPVSVHILIFRAKVNSRESKQSEKMEIPTGRLINRFESSHVKKITDAAS